VDTDELVRRLLAADATLFRGETAPRALGWLEHPRRYLGSWLEETSARLPRRHPRVLVLGMGGSSGAARFYLDSRPDNGVAVLDTSNPDTVAATDFAEATVIASSKSGTTIETQTLLAHALAHGLEPRDLVVITDPGTSLGEMARSIGALVIEGDAATGGRFAGLSPFGLIPALYGGWEVERLRRELEPCRVTSESIRAAVGTAAQLAERIDAGTARFALPGDPIVSGGALWLEQLIAETTGKGGRGFVPVPSLDAPALEPSSIQHHHLVATLLAWHLEVDPFDQPDVERAKSATFGLLGEALAWTAPATDQYQLRAAMQDSSYTALQVYAPLSAASAVATLRGQLDDRYGTTTANLGPRYLHSTGQLHKGGPPGVVAVQVVVRPTSRPVRIAGRHYSFHDLHLAQAVSDHRAMVHAGRDAWQLVVDDLEHAAQVLGVTA
jgi:hypothetical protein